MEYTKEYFLKMVIRLDDDLIEKSGNFIEELLRTGTYNKEDAEDIIRLKARLKMYMKILGFNEDEIQKGVLDYQNIGVELAFSKVINDIDVATLQTRIEKIGNDSVLPEGMAEKVKEEIDKILKYQKRGRKRLLH
ncbi:hypothetical protein J7J90_04605 [Candidatus Micrarchaeota archaeon]|nr:hypothetical protein [Candidatus Micrarchaeota archaeon]